jgi:hypothetical protein
MHGGQCHARCCSVVGSKGYQADSWEWFEGFKGRQCPLKFEQRTGNFKSGSGPGN